MFHTIQCQVDGLKAVYAYDPKGLFACPSAYFEFESIEKAITASEEIIKYGFALDMLEDYRIPENTKFEVILGYSAKENGTIGNPFKTAHELIQRALKTMSSEQEIKKEISIVEIMYWQLRLPYEGMNRSRAKPTHMNLALRFRQPFEQERDLSICRFI